MGDFRTVRLGMMMTARVRAHERAVAPVVGIALLIGITVILAGVIGSVIFGLSAEPSDSPQATVSFSVDADGELHVTHEGGEELAADEVVIKNENGLLNGFTEDRGAGETEETDIVAKDHEQISVVWQDPTSDAETVLGTFKP